ncbi:hypothetical protein DVH24_002048 [Malus domestica]|uniref:Uncharacterized protein n=1 Tax=Malus domestica TaxID=3750 RepID=A0A498I5P8_MALDO|nr:hypothetical protein DVH24_002048 [Malus domestica]
MVLFIGTISKGTHCPILISRFGTTLERIEMPQLATGGLTRSAGVCRQLNTPFKVFELQQDRSGWFLKYESDCSTLIGRTRVCQFSVVTVLDSEREEDRHQYCAEKKDLKEAPGSATRLPLQFLDMELHEGLVFCHIG